MLDLRPTERLYRNGTFNIDTEAPTISADMYVLLARELQGLSFFPTLRKVVWHAATPNTTSRELALLPAIFSSSVETFKVSGHALAQTRFSCYYLELITRKYSSSLKHVSLEHDPLTTGSDIGRTIMNSVLRFTKLESLSIRLPGFTGIEPWIILDTMRHLQELKSLTMDIHIAGHDVALRLNATHAHSASALGLRLSNLKSVHIINRSPNGLCGCYPAFLLEKTTRLTVLLSPSGFHSHEHFTSLTESLARRLPILKRIDLDSIRLTAAEHIASLDPFTIQTLLHFVPCTELKVSVPINYPPAGIASFFPGEVGRSDRCPSRRLTRLFLPPMSGRGTCLNLNTLVFIAENFKALEHLSIGFMPQTHHPSQEIPSTLAQLKNSRKSCSGLRTLSIFDLYGHISLGRFADLAELVDLLFPNLDAILPFEDSDAIMPYWEAEWSSIERIRKAYQAVRMYRSSCRC